MKLFKNVPIFEWDDLDGKSLIIRVEQNEEIKVIYGYDPVGNEIYILAEQGKTKLK
ncbi:UNVERIFIED_CONTAM: hypothetical protein ABIC26_002668 [Paenibacillus sp. PvR008]|jgi:hypothetical protein